MLERLHKPRRKRRHLLGPEPDRVTPGEELAAKLGRNRGNHVRVRAQQVERGERIVSGEPVALHPGDTRLEFLVLRGALGPERGPGDRDLLRAERLDELASVLTGAHHTLEVASDVHVRLGMMLACHPPQTTSRARWLTRTSDEPPSCTRPAA